MSCPARGAYASPRGLCIALFMASVLHRLPKANPDRRTVYEDLSYRRFDLKSMSKRNYTAGGFKLLRELAIHTIINQSRSKQRPFAYSKEVLLTKSQDLGFF